MRISTTSGGAILASASSSAALMPSADALTSGSTKKGAGASIGARILVALVRGYQLIVSPWLGRNCRFEPSCSRYALACVERHGALRGGLLSVKRLCKCHPFHPGGFDPPPEARS